MWSYRAKVERVEIRHENLWIDVLQIPGEALALQPLPEVHTPRYISKGPLWKQFQATIKTQELSATMRAKQKLLYHIQCNMVAIDNGSHTV